MQIKPLIEAEWLAVIVQLDEGKAETARDLSRQLPVSFENDKIEGDKVYHVTPAEVNPRHKEHLFVYIHGFLNAVLFRFSKNFIFQKEINYEYRG